MTATSKLSKRIQEVETELKNLNQDIQNEIVRYQKIKKQLKNNINWNEEVSSQANFVENLQKDYLALKGYEKSLKRRIEWFQE